jgi:hypothetical protein
MSVVVFRKSPDNTPAPSGVEFLGISSYEELLVQINSKLTSTDLCFGFEDSLSDFLKATEGTYDDQKVATLKAQLDTLALGQVKGVLGNLAGCNLKPIPLWSGWLYPPSLVTANSQLVASLLREDPNLTFTKLQQWLRQVLLTQNNIIYPSNLSNPPDFVQPTVVPTGSNIKSYKLLGPTDRTLSLEFDLAVSGSSRLLSDISLADDSPFASIVGKKLIVPVTQSNIKPNVTTSVKVLTNEPTLAGNNTQTTLNFTVNYIESLTIADSNSLQPVDNITFYPGIQDRRFVPLLKLVDGETYNLASSSDLGRLSDLVKLPSSVFTFSTSGSMLQIDPSGYITVPPNNLLPTGPFTKTFKVEGPGHSFLVEESLTVDLNTLVVTRPDSQPARLGQDYFIVDTYPLRITAPTDLSNLTVPYDLALSYSVIRTLAQYTSTQSPQSITLDLGFGYAGWSPSVSTVVNIKPPTGWYKVFDGLGATGLDASQLLNTLGTFSAAVSGLSGGVQSVLRFTDTLKAFIPIFGLFNFQQLPNILTFLLGPIAEQLINIFSTGIYATWFTPADTQKLLTLFVPAEAKSNNNQGAPAPNAGAANANQTGQQSTPQPPQVDKIYTEQDINSFSLFLGYLSANSYWIEPINRSGASDSIFFNTVSKAFSQAFEADKDKVSANHFIQLISHFRDNGLGVYRKVSSDAPRATATQTSNNPSPQASSTRSLDFTDLASKKANAAKKSAPAGKSTKAAPNSTSAVRRGPARVQARPAATGRNVASNPVSSSTTAAAQGEQKPVYITYQALPPLDLDPDYLNWYNQQLTKVYEEIDSLAEEGKIDRYYWSVGAKNTDPTAAKVSTSSKFKFDVSKRNRLILGPSQ